MKSWHQKLGACGSLQVDVPERGVLDFRAGEREIVFLGDAGEEKHFTAHPLADSIHLYVKHVSGAMLLVDEYDHRIYRFSEETLALTPVLELGRTSSDDRAFMSLRFVDTPVGSLLIYENGIASFDPVGAPRWHVVHGGIGGSEFSGLEGNRIVYVNQSGERWAYALDDGRVLPS